MSVVRRGSVSAVVAGLVLVGGPAWAQGEDPCAPGPDGSVPEMCQSQPTEQPAEPEPKPEPAPEEPSGTDPCPPQPVEPGDGVVSDDDQGVAVGEPAPGTEPGTEPEPAPDGEPKPEPEPERVDPETGDPATSDTSREGEPDGIVCAFAVPISAPAAGAPESAVGGGTTAVDSRTNAAVAAGQLPRTGPYDRLLAVAAIGTGLVLAGAGAAAAGRRRTA